MTAPRAEPVRPSAVGIVGCGFVAREHHVPSVLAAGGRVAAVADTDRDAAVAAASLTRGARVHDDPQELFADPDIGLIAICTPPATHAELAIAALDAGNDVVIEKPLALSLDDCDAIIAARDRSGRSALVAFNLRSHPSVSGALALIRRGEVGEVLSITHEWIGPQHDAGPWAHDPLQGGLLVVERGTHAIDLIHAFAGRASESVSMMTGGGALKLALGFDGSAAPIGSSLLVDSPAHRNQLTIAGSKAALFADLYAFDGLRLGGADEIPGGIGSRLRRTFGAPTRLPAAVRAMREGGVFRGSYLRQWRALIGSANGSGTGPATLEEGRAALATALAAVASANEDRTIRVADGPRELAGAGAAR